MNRFPDSPKFEIHSSKKSPFFLQKTVANKTCQNIWRGGKWERENDVSVCVWEREKKNVKERVYVCLRVCKHFYEIVASFFAFFSLQRPLYIIWVHYIKTSKTKKDQHCQFLNKVLWCYFFVEIVFSQRVSTKSRGLEIFNVVKSENIF